MKNAKQEQQITKKNIFSSSLKDNFITESESIDPDSMLDNCPNSMNINDLDSHDIEEDSLTLLHQPSVNNSNPIISIILQLPIDSTEVIFVGFLKKLSTHFYNIKISFECLIQDSMKLIEYNLFNEKTKLKQLDYHKVIEENNNISKSDIRSSTNSFSKELSMEFFEFYLESVEVEEFSNSRARVLLSFIKI